MAHWYRCAPGRGVGWAWVFITTTPKFGCGCFPATPTTGSTLTSGAADWGYAIDYRAAVMGDAFSSNCRLVFGEADQLPGLTVDRFGDILVAQTLSLGMERRKELLFPLLAGAAGPAGRPHPGYL